MKKYIWTTDWNNTVYGLGQFKFQITDQTKNIWNKNPDRSDRGEILTNHGRDWRESGGSQFTFEYSEKNYGSEVFSTKSPTLKNRVVLTDVINLPSSFRISDSCFRDFRVSWSKTCFWRWTVWASWSEREALLRNRRSFVKIFLENSGVKMWANWDLVCGFGMYGKPK